MPVYVGAYISSATYNSALLSITVDGAGFGENEYTVSDILTSPDGVTYTSVDAIDSWSDESVSGVILAELASGSYYVRVITSDNISATSGAGAIVVAAPGSGVVVSGGLCINISFCC